MNQNFFEKLICLQLKRCFKVLLKKSICFIFSHKKENITVLSFQLKNKIYSQEGAIEAYILNDFVKN